MERVYELDALDKKLKNMLIERIEPDPDKRILPQCEDDDEGDDDDEEGCEGCEDKKCAKKDEGEKSMNSLSVGDLARWMLNSDNYGELSFPKNGYAFKEGKEIGEEKGKHYLLVIAEESFFKKYAEKRLSGIFKRCAPTIEKRVLKKLKESGVHVGDGFGGMYQ